MIAQGVPPGMMAAPATAPRAGVPPMDQRSRLRLQSLTWALAAALAAATVTLALALALALALVLVPAAAPLTPLALLAPGPLEAALRSGGCGFFYGLLAFHLQRVDPHDGHLQAGLVGAVCGIRSLAACSGGVPVGEGGTWDANLVGHAPSVMMGLVRGWLEQPLPPPLTHGLVLGFSQWFTQWLPLWLPLVGSALVLQGIRQLTPAAPATSAATPAASDSVP